jgi:hypothetical protein
MSARNVQNLVADGMINGQLDSDFRNCDKAHYTVSGNIQDFVVILQAVMIRQRKGKSTQIQIILLCRLKICREILGADRRQYLLVVGYGTGLGLAVPILAYRRVKQSTDTYEQHQNQKEPYFAFFHKYLSTALQNGGRWQITIRRRFSF